MTTATEPCSPEQAGGQAPPHHELEPTAGHDPLRDELARLRPHEHVEAERLATTIAARMFGISGGSTRIDRFDILDRLGSGGVGVVYRAYDPQLQRPVALKLLRDSSRVGRVEQERLLREAHALARIKHPNVVTVHEVGQLGDRVFVVMELVEGQSLHAWARAKARGVREVLAVYVQAGRGLAAAHAVGLVHRDFKPHNAIIGDDGRVRVVDFGLVRGEGAPDTETDAADVRDPSGEGARTSSSSSMPGGRFEGSLTRPDALLGTPAYMSPEQCCCDPVGPASDQFSFCVALYEALVGTRPFEGQTAEELASNISAGAMREPPRGVRVPAWLLATLRRGMSVAPRDRFGSMEALLAALDRDPWRLRRRWLGGATFTALAGAFAALLLQRTTAAPEPCSGSREALADTWGPTRRAALQEHLGRVSTPAVTTPLLAAIDGYAERWQAMHEQACLAHHRSEQSGVLLDKRMACLARRRAALDGALDVLGTTPAATLEDVVAAVHDLAPLHPCGDLAALEAELPLPEDPEVRSAVSQAREQLARATTLAEAGRHQEAYALAVRWDAQAEQLGHRPLVAEARLVRGRIEMDNDPTDASRPAATLHAAFLAGMEVDDPALAAEALTRSLYVEAIRPTGRAPDDTLGPDLVRVLIGRVPEPSAVEALLLNNLGSIAAAEGDFATARDRFRQALEVRLRAPEPRPIEVLETRFNVAIMADDVQTQRTELEAVADELDRLLGPSDRHTLRARTVLAHTVSDPQVALPRYAELCEAYARHHPEELASCLYDHGLRLSEARELERAAEVLERAAVLFAELEGSVPAQLPVRHALARGQALACRGRHAEVVAELRGVLDGLADREPPRWMEASVLALDVVLGEALVAELRHAEAIAALEPAVGALARRAALRVDHAVERLLVRARLALARAHVDALADDAIVTPDAATAAAALLDAAEPRVREAGSGGAWQLHEIEALREELPARPG